MLKPVTKDRIDTQAASLLIGFSVILGLNQALVKIVNSGMSPLFQAGLRSACAFVLILLYAWLRRRPLDFRNGTFTLGLINGTFFALEFALLFLALDYTSVARVSLFFYTMPFFVAIGAHFLFPGEQFTRVRVLGLGCAITGVALALFSRDSGTSLQVGADVVAPSPLGDFLALLAAMAWAGIALLTRGTKLSQISPEQNMLYYSGVSAVLLLALAPVMGDTLRELTPTIWAIFTFQVVVVASFGFLIWTWLLTVYPVSDMASFSLLTPLSAVFFGWLIFSESLNLAFLMALALVAGGLLLINKR